jgi:hypothetical protein
VATTYHLGDCMQACDKCMENYHSAFDEICPLCYADLTTKENK